MSAVDLTLDDNDRVDPAEPLEFLESLVIGVDPRQKSEILQLVDTIEEENFGDPPDEEQWESLKQLVHRLYKLQPVPLGVSAAAARSLAEYRHAKRKTIEISQNGGRVEVTPLQDEELELFEAWFNAQY